MRSITNWKFPCSNNYKDCPMPNEIVDFIIDISSSKFHDIINSINSDFLRNKYFIGIDYFQINQIVRPIETQIIFIILLVIFAIILFVIIIYIFNKIFINIQLQSKN